jgi:hypothetical protein
VLSANRTVGAASDREVLAGALAGIDTGSADGGAASGTGRGVFSTGTADMGGEGKPFRDERLNRGSRRLSF